MSHYTKHSQQQCNRIAQLRRQKLTWATIAARMGFSIETCRMLAERAK